MKLPYSEPHPSGSDRAKRVKRFRDLAAEVARLRPQVLTRANGEERDFGDKFPVCFTKGLSHNQCGILKKGEDYACFVEAINSPDGTLFEKHVARYTGKFNCQKINKEGKCEDAEWRGWESPRAGHVFELEGPDPGAVGMAPAPRVGSSELAVEMAEVYGLALLRDVPFSVICEGGGKKLCASDKKADDAVLDAETIVKQIASMPFFSGKRVKSSTPCNTGDFGLNGFENNRRTARLDKSSNLTLQTAFRGSTEGAKEGPYVSQFLLIGAGSIDCKKAKGAKSNFPGTSSQFDFRDGFIPYGSLIIDQRTSTQKNCLDYMTDWCSWLDVQNGANFKGLDQFEDDRRFITTPRDLATYVHFDALYEAYLNACLILLGMGVPHSKGFPEPSPSGLRDAFATFGGPHILTLVPEAATRCLKAVRRQKFNYHRRARPEVLGGRLSLACALSSKQDELKDKLGCSAKGFMDLLNEIPNDICEAIIKHNELQNCSSMAGMRKLKCPDPKECVDQKLDADLIASECNLLLPMAFPEGSPMHPAYGAGHATVAGGCVTMLKAFFEMFEDCDSGVERELSVDDYGKWKSVADGGKEIVYEADDTGAELRKSNKAKVLTIQGELDKLTANISIGRNMAGVHYYSDYYDSLRLGERVAVGILMEQAPTYGDAVEMTFKSFDGDMITISGEADGCPSLAIMAADGKTVSPHDWWLRHGSGEEFLEDL